MRVDAERVDPHLEGALLARPLGVLLSDEPGEQVGGRRAALVPVGRREAGQLVEDGGEEAHVELLVALDDVVGLDLELRHAEVLGDLQGEGHTTVRMGHTPDWEGIWQG